MMFPFRVLEQDHKKTDTAPFGEGLADLRVLSHSDQNLITLCFRNAMLKLKLHETSECNS